MGKFSIDFGNAKELELIEPGNYELEIHDYKVFEAKQESSREKGFNIGLVFKLADRPDMDKFQLKHNIWVQYDNPFAAKAFFDALFGEDVGDKAFEEDFISDPNNFIGERVGGFISHSTYTTDSGKVRKTAKIQNFDDFYPLS